MAAAENGALRGGKVGGLADAVAGSAAGLARNGCRVTVVTPAYGFLHRLNPSRPLAEVAFPFGGGEERSSIHEILATGDGVRHLVIDHPASFRDAARPEIYHPDPPHAPFATDATRFARFAAAFCRAGEAGLWGPADLLHLHDWHSGFILLLRRYDPALRGLARLRTVFSIHNLALQGIRPFEGDPSSLAAWYPHLRPPRPEIADPRWPHCVNPMAAGIRFADAVHTVSPSYAAEILLPSDPPRFYGGEGLEADLQAAAAAGRLHGILNGWPEEGPGGSPPPSWSELGEGLQEAVRAWAGAESAVSGAHFVAHGRLEELLRRGRGPRPLLTAVTRAVAQKLFLLRAPAGDGRPALEHVLDLLEPEGRFLLLGAGDPDYEGFLAATAARRRGLIFLNGYAETAAGLLFRAGDLFLVPSSYEPCGIGPMRAMAAGQPCLVHRVGGLRDTVRPGENGFGFTGKTVADQVQGLLAACREALGILRGRPSAWETIRQRAQATRFSWKEAARAYIERLYRPRAA
ncbi:MAG: glycogen/starch synthase [Desulfobacterales bacterium]